MPQGNEVDGATAPGPPGAKVMKTQVSGAGGVTKSIVAVLPAGIVGVAASAANSKTRVSPERAFTKLAMPWVDDGGRRPI